MERISVKPAEVRCLGDIVSSKSVQDYMGYTCKLTESQDSVYGRVFSESSFATSELTVTFPAWVSLDTSSFTLDVELSCSDVQSASGCTVYCNWNGTVSSAVTAEWGRVSFTISPGSGPARHEFRIYYNGSGSRSGCSVSCTVLMGIPETVSDLELMVDKPVLQSGESCELVARCTGETGDGEVLPVPGVQVNFYKVI